MIGGAANGCFNSKLVRLEVDALRIYRESDRSFNSKLVRLEVQISNTPTAVEVMFQFQTGSIRRESICGDGIVLIRFNSKLVRLEGMKNVWKAELEKVSIPNWFD